MKNLLRMLSLSLCLLILVLAISAPASAGQAKAQSALHQAANCFSRMGDDGGTPHNSDFSWGRFDSCNGEITLATAQSWDFHQVRWSRPGVDEQQFSFDGAWTIFVNAQTETIYTFKIQGCNSSIFGTDCSGWDTIMFATYYPGECHPGYVWRGAFASDHACVTPDTRSETAYDNSQAPYRVNPYGAYGPDTCIQGFVWRGIVPDDHVCVTPYVHDQAIYDNAHAAAYTYN